MFNTEALLLVDDDEPQILELDGGIEQLVRADDDVHRAFGKAFRGLFNLLGGLESAHLRHFHRESLIPLGERLVMLLHEQRGGHEHGDLLAVLHGLERGAHGDFGFAEAHVAADQAIHRHGLFHVGFHFVDGAQLVGRLLVRERVLELALPRCVGAEGESGRGLARRI